MWLAWLYDSHTCLMGKAITHAKLRRAVHSYGAMTLVGWNALMMFDDLNSHILALPSRCLQFPPTALKALRFRHEEVDQDWCFAHTSSYQHPSLQLVGRFGPKFTQCVDNHTLRKSMDPSGPSVATFPWDTSQVPRAEVFAFCWHLAQSSILRQQPSDKFSVRWNQWNVRQQISFEDLKPANCLVNQDEWLSRIVFYSYVVIGRFAAPGLLCEDLWLWPLKSNLISLTLSSCAMWT